MRISDWSSDVCSSDLSLLHNEASSTIVSESDRETDMTGASNNEMKGSLATRPGYLLFLLMTGYLLSFLDRQLLVMMIDPINRDFALTDTDFSLLYGFAFATFYTVLGLVFGRLL